MKIISTGEKYHENRFRNRRSLGRGPGSCSGLWISRLPEEVSQELKSGQEEPAARRRCWGSSGWGWGGWAESKRGPAL